MSDTEALKKLSFRFNNYKQVLEFSKAIFELSEELLIEVQLYLSKDNVEVMLLPVEAPSLKEGIERRIDAFVDLMNKAYEKLKRKFT